MKCLFVEGKNLAAVWEQAVIRCWGEGSSFKTQYDRDGDLPSRDSTMLLHVTEPFSEPRYHLGMCMGFEDLEKYVCEVIYGVHDHWMDDETNPNRWKYSYYKRLFSYEVEQCGCIYYRENQIKKAIAQLKECGYTRRANVSTWQPWNDPNIEDCPCLQSLLFRVENDKLNMNVRFRSNDLLKATFPNMIALTELQRLVAKEVGVEVGEYVHLSDSMHIYSKDFPDVVKLLSLVEKRAFNERVYKTDMVAPYFLIGCEQLLEEDGMPEDKKQLVRERMKKWTTT